VSQQDPILTLTVRLTLYCLVVL